MKVHHLLEATDFLADIEREVNHAVERPETMIGMTGINIFPWNAYGGLPNKRPDALKSIISANKAELAANRDRLETPIVRFTLAWLKHYHQNKPIIQYDAHSIRKWIKFLRSHNLDFAGLHQVEKNLAQSETIEEQLLEGQVAQHLNQELGHYLYTGASIATTRHILDYIELNALERPFIMRWLLDSVRHHSAADATARRRLVKLAQELSTRTTVGPTKDEVETIKKSLLRGSP